jgi:hypothetical protein
MQHLEMDQMLVTGEAPTRWSHPRHFSDREGGTQTHIPTTCGAWYNGHNHFVTFYLCADYWSLIDSLMDIPCSPPRMQANLNKALRQSFLARNLPVPPLPPYRQLPRIAIQRDVPRPNWSCGTIAMCTILHLLIGNIQLHTLPRLYISRDRIISPHKILLAWLLTGTPPAMWEIGCLHKDIIPPSMARIGPYAQISVAATIESPKGEHWRPHHPPQIQVATPNSVAPPTQHNGNHI